MSVIPKKKDIAVLLNQITSLNLGHKGHPVEEVLAPFECIYTHHKEKDINHFFIIT